MLRSIVGFVAACFVCAAGAQQLVENFDDVAGLTAAGWVTANNSAPAGSTGWFQGNTGVFASQAGVPNSYVAANFNAATPGGNISLWALSPVLNFQNGVVVSFFTRTEVGAPTPDRLELRLSLNGASTNVGASDTSVGDFTTVLVAVNAAQAGSGYPETWTQFTVTLSGLPAGVTQGRLGFRYFVTNTTTAGDYIGIDTLVVSGAPPDMTVAKSHTGNFAQGQNNASYTITATNSGGQSTSGTVTVVDTLPAGLTATAIGGSGWTCTLATLTCTRSDALAAGSSYPSIVLTVDVSPTAPASVTNTVTVSGGGETNTGNNTASDPTTITPAFADLTIAKSHVGNFALGQAGAAYSIVVSNAGSNATTGTVTVVDTLPSGLTATAIAGTGWTCTLATLTCTRSDVLAAGASYPPITLTVNVGTSPPFIVTNVATVSGGGETNTGNNTASDPTTITFPDLAVTKSHSGNFSQGQVGAAYTIVVRNVGASSTVGAVDVVDDLPVGMVPNSIGGPGWTCTLAPFRCSRSDALAPGSSYPPITATVNIFNGPLPGSLPNTATVYGIGDTNPSNNVAVDTATILPAAPDLTVTKTHPGNFFFGQTGATYTIVVSNAGPGVTSGTVTVVDTLPAGLTATAMTGTGWTCTVATATCTRADSLAAGASYPSITLTVNVAPTAPGSVVNVVTVSGGGDTTPGNSSASDSTVIAAPNTPQVPIPTLGQWGLLLLMGMLAVAGAGALRRRH